MDIKVYGMENLTPYGVLDEEAVELMKVSMLRAMAIGGESCHLYLNKRVPDDAAAWNLPEWLEFRMIIGFQNETQMVLGCLQRVRGGEYEFHS